VLRRSILTLPALGLSACGQPPATPGLTVASFPDLDRASRAVLADWNALEPEHPLQLVSRNYADHHNAMNAALATGSGLPDVMALDLRFIGKFAAGGGLVDLRQPPYQVEPRLDALPRFSVAQARNAAGALVALPTDIGPGTLLYRQDLLAAAGLAEADLTHSWEHYLQAGQRLRRQGGQALLTDAADLRDILLRASLREGEGLYFDADGRPLVRSARFEQAFEFGLRARQLGLDLRAPAWTNEWTAAFRQGRVATQMMGCWLAGHLKNWLAPEQAGRWRAAALPGGGAASWGGSFYAIPKGAAHKQAAWRFIQHMVFKPATQLQSLQLLDAFPALRSTHTQPVMDEALPYLGGQRARQLWREVASRVPATPVHKFDSLATTIVRDAFEQVVTQGRAIRTVLSEAEALILRRARR
jgi:multiple sugar transport system substrate-binding protein